jgi:hypothetical protein
MWLLHMCLLPLRPVSTQEQFPRSENFPKILLKVQFNFSDGKFVSANHILQNFLSVENFPEWKTEWMTGFNSYNMLLSD